MGPAGRRDPAGARVAAYPGTFDPPTLAHLAVAEAAWRQGGLDRIVLVVSRQPLGKDPAVPTLDDRLAVLEEVASSRPWMDVTVTIHRLIADVCAGYDAVVLGSDKWAQVVDPAWYSSSAERDRAVAALPPVLLAVRHGHEPPDDLPPGSVVLDVADHHRPVSSTAVRSGRWDWMASEAAEFDRRSGAWSDPERYRRWRHARVGAGPRANVSPMAPPPPPAPAEE